MNELNQDGARALDAADPLYGLRDLFLLPSGVIYLDGNSLGPMPRATPGRVADVVQREWGQDLITSWNKAGWFASPQTMGDKIARLIGAGAGEVVATDSISINLYKLLHAAISIAEDSMDAATKSQKAVKTTKVIVSERDNFPTDLYIAQALCHDRGWTLKLCETTEIEEHLSAAPGIVMLTHVNYRTGAMHDMAGLTARAQAMGSLVVWDLAHSAGAVEVDLRGANADFAVGCGYKYLNGGPGSPAFLWVHPRHVERFSQPLSGWWGHAAPFAFTPDYAPAPGVARYLCGTQPIISMAALSCGLDTLLAAEALGGMAALRQKSLALTTLFANLVDARCAHKGITVVSPRVDAQRGSQVCLTRDSGDMAADSNFCYAVMQALIARGVIGDYRAGAPPIMRFGFAPLYIGFEDVWHAVAHLVDVLNSEEWREPRFNARGHVT